MQITAPFGYLDIVPLEKHHRVMLPHSGGLPTFIRECGSLIISASELQTAGHDYPIVFAQSEQGRMPVALLGFANNENLFVDADLKWRTDAYVPAFVRRYPFCLSKMVVNGQPSTDLVACVVSAYLDDSGKPLYYANGVPTDDGKRILELLQTYEADLERTRLMMGLLHKMELFEPMSMTAQTAQGPLTLQGFERISQDKFKQLPAKNLREMIENGLMALVYAHWASLEHFSRLLMLHNASHPAQQAQG